MDQIKQIFGSSQIYIKEMEIYVQRSGDSVPADLLGSNPIRGSLYFYGVFSSLASYASLSVDRNAFRSSRNSLLTLSMFYLDTTKGWPASKQKEIDPPASVVAC